MAKVSEATFELVILSEIYKNFEDVFPVENASYL